MLKKLKPEALSTDPSTREREKDRQTDRQTLIIMQY
jgi:hypothetical protein